MTTTYHAHILSDVVCNDYRNSLVRVSSLGDGIVQEAAILEFVGDALIRTMPPLTLRERTPLYKVALEKLRANDPTPV